MKIKPSDDGESEYEAYHSVFSWLTSTEHIYRKLAGICGSEFKYVKSDADVAKFDKNTIFCEKADSTHYKFFDISDRTIHDPYMYYQLNNTHGNCFIYALYLSSEKTGTNVFDKHIERPLIKITDTSHMKTKTYNKQNYLVVNSKREHKQAAYKMFVHNDFVSINMMLKLLKKHPDVLEMYAAEWAEITDEDKTHYGIPEKYTFKKFLNDFCKISADIDKTRYAIWDQITNWDYMVTNHRLPQYKNSGIEGSTDIKPDDYLM